MTHSAFLLLLFFIPCIASIPKLLIIWAIVEPNHVYSDMLGTWDECIDKCVNDETCILMSQTSTGCSMHWIADRYVYKSDSTSGTRVGMKRVLDKCPLIEQGPPMFGLSFVEEYYYGTQVYYNITMTETVVGETVQWKFKVIVQGAATTSTTMTTTTTQGTSTEGTSSKIPQHGPILNK